MGDKFHKKPPPDDPEEDVTERFRSDAREALDINAKRNRLGKRRKGDAGYLISNRAELAIAVGTDKTMINKIIGPARATTKIKLVYRSAFVAAIRAALDLETTRTIVVPESRADALKRLANLSDEDFALFADEAERSPRR